jgi:hypothetical protein
MLSRQDNTAVCPPWCRGLTAAGLQSVLQALCQATRSSYDVIEDWVEATLLLPDSKLSEAVGPFLASHCDVRK